MKREDFKVSQEKETAVEWLISKIERNENPSLTQKEVIEYIEKAKEMEKHQIMDAWNDGNNQYSGIGDSETYYETFKKI